MELTITFTRGSQSVDTTLASGTRKHTDPVSGLTVFEKPGASTWFRGAVAEGPLAGLPTSLGTGAMTADQFDALRKAVREYFIEIQSGLHGVPTGFPHVGIRITCESATELRGRDGLITVFPNHVTAFACEPVAPFESETEKQLLREITVKAQAVARVEQRTGLLSTLGQILSR